MSGCLSCHSILDWTVRSEWQYTLCYLQWKIHNNAVLPHSGIARSDTAQDVVLLATWILFIARSDTAQDVVLLATWILFIAGSDTAQDVVLLTTWILFIARSDTAQDVVLLATWILFIARSDTVQDVVLLATWNLFIARSDTAQDVVLLATWNLFIARISTTVFYTSCYSSGFPTVCHTMSACSHSSDEGPSFHLSHTHTHFTSFHCHILQPLVLQQYALSALWIITLW